MTAARISAADRLLYRPEEAAEVLAIGRPKLFELLASGEIESYKIGGSRRISRAALEGYVERLSAGGGQAA